MFVLPVTPALQASLPAEGRWPWSAPCPAKETRGTLPPPLLSPAKQLEKNIVGTTLLSQAQTLWVTVGVLSASIALQASFGAGMGMMSIPPSPELGFRKPLSQMAPAACWGHLAFPLRRETVLLRLVASALHFTAKRGHASGFFS